MKKSLPDRAFDVCNTVFMVVMLLIFVYPLYFTIIASFSEPYDVAQGNVTFWIRGFTVEAYQNVFKNDRIWLGYRNSLFYTVVGTLFQLFMTIPAAYVLSKKVLPGRTALSWFFLFTMFFGGGLIPYYLLVRDIGLLNKPYSLIVLGGFSVYNMVVSRVFFSTSIPDTLYEAAYIDGSSEFRSFFAIAMPLSAPIIAVIALYYAVGHWNDYFTGMVFVSNQKLFPLQLVLRSILIMNENMLQALDRQSGLDAAEAKKAAIRMAYMAQAMKYSLIIIASLPMFIAYPFVQKYFVKGVMIGSLKG